MIDGPLVDFHYDLGRWLGREISAWPCVTAE
jgi:hypothetical protein